MPETNESVPVLCRYLVKSDHVSAFGELLTKHWSVLHGEGLTTEQPARIQRASDKAGHIAFIEQFSWRTGDCAQAAHENPAVMELWEPMGAFCEDMEFWNVEDISR